MRAVLRTTESSPTLAGTGTRALWTSYEIALRSAQLRLVCEQARFKIDGLEHCLWPETDGTCDWVWERRGQRDLKLLSVRRPMHDVAPLDG